MRAPAPPRSFARIALIITLLVLAGSIPTAARSQPKPDAAQVHNSWEPQLLYLLPSPHSRLHVEIDAVHGNEPDDAALEKLRAFLSTHCRKPDGVEIVRSDVIPGEAARGFSPEALARKYLNGPDKTNASPPAFMYLLYYSYPLSRHSSADRILHRGATTLPARRPQNANPYTDVSLYPAIYFNTGFSLGIAMDEILLHETGHMLGMVNRSARARDGHCLNRPCQMNTHRAYLHQLRWLPGRRPSPLCADCVAELSQRANQPPAPNVRYIGPVLVRSEADYHVAILPDRVGIIVGSLTDHDCRQFAAALRSEPGQADDGRIHAHCLVKDDVLKDPAGLSAIINRFKNDPIDLVRRGGPSVFLRACANRYDALGQYTNAVETLRQAILLDSRDAWSYNKLAWIKATCPDGSIRNGQDAVSAANKACELTQWRNWRFIDTLAAACAEAGDFQRAIQFQQRTLRTPNPTASEQNVMRGRLSLYQQSKPFRQTSDRP